MLLYRNFAYVLNELFVLENLRFAKGFQLLLGEQIFAGVKTPLFYNFILKQRIYELFVGLPRKIKLSRILI